MTYSTISFPSLGIEIDPIRQFQIGPLSIHLYGLIIATGLILAVCYALRRKEQFGITEDDLLDGVLWIVPFAIICARLYYCAFTWEAYASNPIRILYIWEGGLAIYGGVIGAILGIFIFAKIRKLNPFAILDLVALGFLIGQAIGRWGNFFNREAFGEATDSFLRMGLLNTITGKVEYYHPTFLYESVWNLAGLLILHFLSKKRQYDGQIALGYVAWYGLGRAFIEGLRTDSLWWGPFRVSQLLAAISCAVAVIILVIQAFRPHDRSKLYCNRVAAAKAAEAAAEAPQAEEIQAEAPQAEQLQGEESQAEEIQTQEPQENDKTQE